MPDRKSSQKHIQTAERLLGILAIIGGYMDKHAAPGDEAQPHRIFYKGFFKRIAILLDQLKGCKQQMPVWTAIMNELEQSLSAECAALTRALQSRAAANSQLSNELKENPLGLGYTDVRDDIKDKLLRGQSSLVIEAQLIKQKLDFIQDLTSPLAAATTVSRGEQAVVKAIQSVFYLWLLASNAKQRINKCDYPHYLELLFSNEQGFKLKELKRLLANIGHIRHAQEAYNRSVNPKFKALMQRLQTERQQVFADQKCIEQQMESFSMKCTDAELSSLPENERSLLTLYITGTEDSFRRGHELLADKAAFLDFFIEHLQTSASKPQRLHPYEFEALLRYYLVSTPIGPLKRPEIYPVTFECQELHADFIQALKDKHAEIQAKMQAAYEADFQLNATAPKVKAVVDARLPEPSSDNSEAFMQRLSEIERHPGLSSEDAVIEYLESQKQSSCTLLYDGKLICKERTRIFAIALPKENNLQQFTDTADSVATSAIITQLMNEAGGNMPQALKGPVTVLQAGTLQKIRLNSELISATFSPRPGSDYYDTQIVEYKNSDSNVVYYIKKNGRYTSHSGDIHVGTKLLHKTQFQKPCSVAAGDVFLLMVVGFRGTCLERFSSARLGANTPDPVLILFTSDDNQAVQRLLLPINLAAAYAGQAIAYSAAVLRCIDPTRQEYHLYVPLPHQGLHNGNRIREDSIDVGLYNPSIQKYVNAQVEEARKSMARAAEEQNAYTVPQAPEPAPEESAAPEPMQPFTQDKSYLPADLAQKQMQLALKQLADSGVLPLDKDDLENKTLKLTEFVQRGLKDCYLALKKDAQEQNFGLAVETHYFGPAEASKRTFAPLACILKGSNALNTETIHADTAAIHLVKQQGQFAIFSIYHVTADDRWNSASLLAATQQENTAAVIFHLPKSVLSSNEAQQKAEVQRDLRALKAPMFLNLGPLGLCLVAIGQRLYLYRPVCREIYQGLLPDNINTEFSQGHYPEVTDYLGGIALHKLKAWFIDLRQQGCQLPNFRSLQDRRIFYKGQYLTEKQILTGLNGKSLAAFTQQLPLLESALIQWSGILPHNDFEATREQLMKACLEPIKQLVDAQQKNIAEIYTRAKSAMPDQKEALYAQISVLKAELSDIAKQWQTITGVFSLVSSYQTYKYEQIIPRIEGRKSHKMAIDDLVTRLKSVLGDMPAVQQANVENALNTTIQTPDILRRLGEDADCYRIEPSVLKQYLLCVNGSKHELYFSLSSTLSSIRQVKTASQEAMLRASNPGPALDPGLKPHPLAAEWATFMGNAEGESQLILPRFHKFSELKDLDLPETYWKDLANIPDIAALRIRLRNTIAGSALLKEEKINLNPSDPKISFMLLGLLVSAAETAAAVKEEAAVKNALGYLLSTMIAGTVSNSRVYQLFLSPKDQAFSKLTLMDLNFVLRLTKIIPVSGLPQQIFKNNLKKYLIESCRRSINPLNLSLVQRSSLSRDLEKFQANKGLLASLNLVDAESVWNLLQQLAGQNPPLLVVRGLVEGNLAYGNITQALEWLSPMIAYAFDGCDTEQVQRNLLRLCLDPKNENQSWQNLVDALVPKLEQPVCDGQESQLRL